MSDNFKSVALIEKDTNGDIMLSWCYPSIDKIEEEIILSQSFSNNIPNFSFSKYKNTWFYIYCTQPEENSNLKRLSNFSVCLLTKTFHPEKYEILCKLLAKSYASTGNVLKLLEGFLSTFIRGNWDCGSLGKFVDSEIDLKPGSIKDVINIFGMNIILVWMALLFKKRIIVYCDNLLKLLKIIRVFPLFVTHRQNWDILRPFVNGSKAELEDLQNAGVYVAGFIDPVKASDSSLIYDIYVDVPAQQITIASNSNADFRTGSYHKEIATYLVNSAEDKNLSDQDLINGLSAKTRKLIEKLKSWCTKNNDGTYSLSMETLKEQKLPASMDRFFSNLSIAENIAIT